jgi:hypothetical protein
VEGSPHLRFISLANPSIHFSRREAKILKSEGEKVKAR